MLRIVGQSSARYNARDKKHESDLLIDQIGAIDNRRLLQGPMTCLPKALMAKAGEAIREVLDLVDE